MRTLPVLTAAVLSLSVLAQAAEAAEPKPAAKAEAAKPAESRPSEAKPADKAEAPKWEFEQFQLVILKRAPNPPQLDKEKSAELQKQHIGHLEAMNKAGKLMIAGPLSDQADQTFRGICLYKVGSVAEARTLAEQDPAVKAGRLVVDVMTWHVGKGYMAFPKTPPVAEAAKAP